MPKDDRHHCHYETTIEKIDETQDVIFRKIDEMHGALMGTMESPESGVIPRLGSVERRHLREDKAKSVRLRVLLGILGAVVSGVILTIILHFAGLG